MVHTVRIDLRSPVLWLVRLRELDTALYGAGKNGERILCSRGGQHCGCLVNVSVNMWLKRVGVWGMKGRETRREPRREGEGDG